MPWSGGQSPGRLEQMGRACWYELRRIIRRIRPDMVQAGPLQRSAFLAALAGFQPLVSMSWGYDLLHDAQRNAAWGWATRYTLQHSAALVGDCDTIRQLAVSYGMPAERIVTFPWGIDLAAFFAAASAGTPRSRHRSLEPRLLPCFPPAAGSRSTAWRPSPGHLSRRPGSAPSCAW